MNKPTYRIWDRRKKIMWKPENVASLDLESECAWIKQPYKGGHWVYFKDADLLESTGLKDMNGIDIYEGDLLSGYDVESGETILPIMGVYWSTRGMWDCESFILGGINETCQIIGNVYENSELLNQ